MGVKPVSNLTILWFEVVRRILRDPTILAENVNNIDETRVM